MESILSSGVLAQRNSDIYFAAIRGLIKGYKKIDIVGRALLANANLNDVWMNGGVLTWLSAASTISVVSDSANDAAAGTGARSIILYGLDSNFDEIQETVALNGLTPVVTTNSFIRVNHAEVITTGTYGASNAGNITGSSSVGSFVQFKIAYDAANAIGLGVAQKSHYTIPRGYTGYILSWSAGLNSNKIGTFWLFNRHDGSIGAPPYSAFHLVDSFDTNNCYQPFRGAAVDSAGLTCPEMTDIKFVVKGANTDVVRTRLELLLVPN